MLTIVKLFYELTYKYILQFFNKKCNGHITMVIMLVFTYIYIYMECIIPFNIFQQKKNELQGYIM